jgi:FKBP-type peptidyl-prolyl cis-trans isomerase
MSLGETSRLKVRFDSAYSSYLMAHNVPPRANIVFTVTILQINGWGHVTMPWRVLKRLYRASKRNFWLCKASAALMNRRLRKLAHKLAPSLVTYEEESDDSSDDEDVGDDQDEALALLQEEEEQEDEADQANRGPTLAELKLEEEERERYEQQEIRRRLYGGIASSRGDPSITGAKYLWSVRPPPSHAPKQD